MATDKSRKSINTQKLPETLFIPELWTNSLSVSKITKMEQSFNLKKHQARVKNKIDEVVLWAKPSHGFCLDNAIEIEKGLELLNGLEISWSGKW